MTDRALTNLIGAILTIGMPALFISCVAIAEHSAPSDVSTLSITAPVQGAPLITIVGVEGTTASGNARVLVQFPHVKVDLATPAPAGAGSLANAPATPAAAPITITPSTPPPTPAPKPDPDAVTSAVVWYCLVQPGKDGVLGTADDVWGPWMQVEAAPFFQDVYVELPATSGHSLQLQVQYITATKPKAAPPSVEGRRVYTGVQP